MTSLQQKSLFLFILVIITASYMGSSLHSAEERNWTSGKYTTTAEFVSFVDENTVLLRKTDGKEIQVSIDKLSDRDKKYLEKRKAEIPERNMVTSENFISVSDDGEIVYLSENNEKVSCNIRDLSFEELYVVICKEIEKYKPDESLDSVAQIEELVDVELEEAKKKALDFGIYKREVKRCEIDTEYANLLEQLNKKIEELEEKLKKSEKDGVTKPTKKNIQRFNQLSEFKAQRKAILEERISIIGLTELEKKSFVLVLLKYQEKTQEKHDKYELGLILSIILSSSSFCDTYTFMQPISESSRINLRAEQEHALNSLRFRANVALDAFADGLISEKEADRLVEGGITKGDEIREKYDLSELYPYCNLFSGFRHDEEEKERIKRR